MRPIIKVEDVSKVYRIGKAENYHTLRDKIAQALVAPVSRISSMVSGNGARNATRTEVSVLSGISFEVMPGEVVGLVGRNGAGKSTLLKILSRITDPTRGRIELYGRVGSLLEVGTGFHQELTGRENIFLSGAILGMRRNEIARKFDEIVEFAEIEQFIDTPVKRYSSGMYVRLAFAVAAHLEPEILLIDEVLAVGDAAFQKRCLGKMGDVARAGRTIVFVSHNMAAIQSLCGSCLFIDGGKLEAKGDPGEIVARYLAANAKPKPSHCLERHPGRTRYSIPAMKSIELLSENGGPGDSVPMGSSLTIKVRFDCDGKALSPVLIVMLKSAHQSPVFAVSNKYNRQFLFEERMSSGTVTCEIERLPLMPGTYYMDLYFGSELIWNIDEIRDAASFEVIPADVFGGGTLPPASAGPVFWHARFTIGNN